ncbi:radical SAM protein [Neptuniibacter halophilus]|uniref:radical SAM protein n=1 Tax=Neptuniibacter halophilus TaxID=651666 RepID=UPI0025722C0C|nr:radical SAM protein [Neptuniibacter halophilus]
MQYIRSENWFYTPQGEARGYIDPHRLRELWFHTGTACNLQCPFCLEGSAPGDKRLELIKFDDVKPYIDEALELGVEQFSFTGGEPFLARQLVKILAYAAQHRPCLVLTNGTEAIQQRMDEVAGLKQAAHPVSFRISIDHPSAEAHDAGRGEGNFVKAMCGLQRLHQAGFTVSVARHMRKDEDKVAVEAAYRALFADWELPQDLNIVAFPDFATPGSLPQVPQVTTACMTTYQDEASRREFMCAYSKMIVKKNGRMRVYACTLVDDDEEYDLGASLKQSLQERISMKHHRCYSCFAYGASCSEG